MTAETVPEEMAENVSDEEAETEIITIKMAETEEVVKSVENFRYLFFKTSQTISAYFDCRNVLDQANPQIAQS